MQSNQKRSAETKPAQENPMKIGKINILQTNIQNVNKYPKRFKLDPQRSSSVGHVSECKLYYEYFGRLIQAEMMGDLRHN